MAESPTSSLDQAAIGARDGLLPTKLTIPRTRPDRLARSRLLERLNQGMARELILVCTPAGFGKTTLLADWAASVHCPVAWLSLDPQDNDPARFWRYVVAALDAACGGGLAGQLLPLLNAPSDLSSQGVVTALIRQLETPGEQVVLVLDDYHMLDAAPIHDGMAFLLRHLPPRLHPVLTGRSDPALPLARLRATGQLVELRAADLRFTPQETAALLRQVWGLDLSTEAIAALGTRTEGWAVGLQLAALSLAGRPDAEAFLEDFTGSHRYVLDYLSEEVLARQSKRLVRFLLETSVLERLSGPLCDAVTGRTDSQAMLEAVERANLFLVPLDEVRRWWRYHHLFADLLRARLQQQQPSRIRQLNRHAASWHDEHGLADDAVRHALAAGDDIWAARLIERHADALLVRSEGATLQRWLTALPAEVVGSRPRLLLAQATLALVSGHVEAVGVHLDAAERALVSAADVVEEPYEPSVGKAAGLLVNLPATIAFERAYLAELQGDAERTIAFATRALAELGEGEWMLRSIVQGHLAVAEWLRGRLPEAEQALSSSIAQFRAAGARDVAGPLPETERAVLSSIAQWRVAGARYQAVRACHHLGLVQRAQGRLSAAHATYQQALEIAAAPGQPDPPAAGIAFVGMAEVAYQQDELDAAVLHVTKGIPLCRQLAYSQPLARGLATLACIRHVQGDVAGALDAIGEAERAAPPGPGVISLLNPVAAQRARLLLAQGDVVEAARWTKQRGLGADDEPSYPREPEHLVLARVLLMQDLPERALTLLERLHHAAVAQGRTGSVIEIQVLRALALASRGDLAAALVALAEALSLGCAQGYVRVFADEGAPMGALLSQLATARRMEHGRVRSVPLNYLGRLMRALEPETASRAAATRQGRVVVPGLIEPLTARELEVLRLLAAGKPNREIAQELVVTVETVKKHASHIFDKLGAANRTQATARARELGLLD